MIRNADFSIVVRHDSIVVTADTVDLRETADGVQRAVDVDAIIGSRWKLVLDGKGVARIDETPVVTRDIADVSDVRTAFDEFFPAAPPAIAVKGSVTDSLHRIWSRSADSAGLHRFHFSRTAHNLGSQSMADTLAVQSDENTTEETDIVWDMIRGPLAWTRHLTTQVSSKYAGRTMRATIDQRFVVRRLR